MKKSILTLILCLTVLGQAYAFLPPLDDDSEMPLSVRDTGVRVAFVENTTPIVVRGSTIAIHGVLTSTRPFALGTTAYIHIRATDTANTISELLFPPINVSSTTKNTLLVFDPPLLAPSGFSLYSTSEGVKAALFYTFLATSTAANYRIPYNNYGGKSHDWSLYGVEASTNLRGGGLDNDQVGADGFDYTTAERQVSTERSFLYGVCAGTGAATNYVVLQDTASVLGTPTDALPPIFYNTNGSMLESSVDTNKCFNFPWPVIFINGIVQARGAADAFRIFARPARRLRWNQP